MGFLDWGRNFLNSMPLTGGITTSLWGDPDQERVQKAFEQSQQDLAKQRAYQMDSRSNMLSQGALAFGPRNQLLGQMNGQEGPLMDLSQILKNPMSQQQQQDIRSAAFPEPHRTVNNDAYQMMPQNMGTQFNYVPPGGSPQRKSPYGR